MKELEISGQKLFSQGKKNSRNGKTKFMSSLIPSLLGVSVSTYYFVVHWCKIPNLGV